LDIIYKLGEGEGIMI